MRKYILEHTQITNTFDAKIILQYYILYLWTAELRSNFSSILKDAFDIDQYYFCAKCDGHLCMLVKPSQN